MTTRIGLLFGSFDPAHTGHLHIAHQTLQQGWVQQIEFVLTPQNPFKSDNSLAPTHHRLLMLKEALKDTPYHLNQTELGLPAPHYTVRTLQKIKERRPENSFCLLMGEDQLCSLHRWKGIESIQSYVDKFLVYHRNGIKKVNTRPFFNVYPLASFRERHGRCLRQRYAGVSSRTSLYPWMDCPREWNPMCESTDCTDARGRRANLRQCLVSSTILVLTLPALPVKNLKSRGQGQSTGHMRLPSVSAHPCPNKGLTG